MKPQRVTKQPVCPDCYSSRVVFDVVAERFYRERTSGEPCVRCDKGKVATPSRTAKAWKAYATR